MRTWWPHCARRPAGSGTRGRGEGARPGSTDAHAHVRRQKQAGQALGPLGPLDRACRPRQCLPRPGQALADHHPRREAAGVETLRQRPETPNQRESSARLGSALDPARSRLVKTDYPCKNRTASTSIESLRAGHHQAGLIAAGCLSSAVRCRVALLLLLLAVRQPADCPPRPATPRSPRSTAG